MLYRKILFIVLLFFLTDCQKKKEIQNLQSENKENSILKRGQVPDKNNGELFLQGGFGA